MSWPFFDQPLPSVLPTLPAPIMAIFMVLFSFGEPPSPSLDEGGSRSVDQPLCAAEHHVPDRLGRQEVVREAEVDLAGGIQLLDLLRGHRERQAAQVVLELR